MLILILINAVLHSNDISENEHIWKQKKNFVKTLMTSNTKS